MDQIHGLHLALHVIEQCNRNIEPVQVCHTRNAKPVFRADQQNYARFLTYYRHFTKHVEKTRLGSEKLLSARVIYLSHSDPATLN